MVHREAFAHDREIYLELVLAEAEAQAEEVVARASDSLPLQVLVVVLPPGMVCTSLGACELGHRIVPEFDLLQGVRREVGLGCCI